MPLWTTEAEYQLLLAVIQKTGLQGSPKWEEIAAYMGNQWTASAVQQKFDRIRRSVPKPDPSGTGSAPVTPRKRNTKKDAATPASTGKRNRAKVVDASNENDEVDGDFGMESPTKKQKTLVKKEEPDAVNATVFKLEGEGETIDLDDEEQYI